MSFALRASFIKLLLRKVLAAELAYLQKVWVCLVLKLKMLRLVMYLGETSSTLK